jgi:hypothetical protein
MGGLTKSREIEITGRVSRFTCARPDFSAGSFRPDKRSREQHPDLALSVRFRFRGLVPGGPVHMVGLWPTHHPRWGTQIEVLSAEALADRVDWVAAYLQATVSGVGEVAAAKLLERGPALLDLLDAPNAVGRLADELGIQPRVAAAMVARWQQLGDWERDFERVIREAGVNAGVRRRLEAHLRKRTRWGVWAELPDEGDVA